MRPRHTNDTWTHLMTLAPSLAHGRGVPFPAERALFREPVKRVVDGG